MHIIIYPFQNAHCPHIEHHIYRAYKDLLPLYFWSRARVVCWYSGPLVLSRDESDWLDSWGWERMGLLGHDLVARCRISEDWKLS